MIKNSFSSKHSQLTIIILLTASLPARSNNNTKPSTSILELDEDGQVILKVRLYPRGRPRTPKTFRFALDTGSTFCALDSSVPPAFFWNDSTTLNPKDATAASMTVPMVIIKRIQVGDITRDDIPAVFTNLKDGMVGRFEDQPVDGILGMNFLDGTRFLLDAKRGRLDWWGHGSSSGATLPIRVAKDKSRLLTLRVDGKEGECRVDTGMLAGLILPWKLRPQGTATPSTVLGLAGEPISGDSLEIPNVEAGNYSWKKVPVTFQKRIETGLIGMEVWSAGPVCFDFIKETITLTKNTNADLAITNPSYHALPVIWDRTGSTQKLFIYLVKPGSPMQVAGFQAGDEIVQAGALNSSALTRRSIRKLIDQGRPQKWILKRNNNYKELTFPLPAQPAPSPDQPNAGP